MNKILMLMMLAAAFNAGRLHGQAITAITYNLRFDNPSDGPDAWPERRSWLAAQIRFYNPDLLGVQEALLSQLLYLDQECPAYARVGVGRDDGADKGEFSALLYRRDRFELLGSGTFWLSPTPEGPSKGWDAALPRVCTWAHLRDRLNGKELWVYNTHFDHIGREARLESARLILSRIREQAGSAPAILMGDLNATPDDAPIALLRAGLHDTRQRSVEPAFGPEATFNGFKFHEIPANRIDYIFVNDPWRVLQQATLTDSRNGHYPSDHFPVLARIDWPEAAAGSRGGRRAKRKRG